MAEAEEQDRVRGGQTCPFLMTPVPRLRVELSWPNHFWKLPLLTVVTMVIKSQHACWKDIQSIAHGLEREETNGFSTAYSFQIE